MNNPMMSSPIATPTSRLTYSTQVFVALKRLGVDTEFVRYPDEFHGMSRTGRTDRRIERIKHILRWFDKYLK